MVINLFGFSGNLKPKTEKPLFRGLLVGFLPAGAGPGFMGCSASWNEMKNWAGYRQ